MFYQFLLHSKVTQLHIYMHSFSHIILHHENQYFWSHWDIFHNQGKAWLLFSVPTARPREFPGEVVWAPAQPWPCNSRSPVPFWSVCDSWSPALELANVPWRTVREFGWWGKGREEKSCAKVWRCECTQCVYRAQNRWIIHSVRFNLPCAGCCTGNWWRRGHRPALGNLCHVPKYIYLQTHFVYLYFQVYANIGVYIHINNPILLEIYLQINALGKGLGGEVLNAWLGTSGFSSLESFSHLAICVGFWAKR